MNKTIIKLSENDNNAFEFFVCNNLPKTYTIKLNIAKTIMLCSFTRFSNNKTLAMAINPFLIRTLFVHALAIV